MKKFQFIFITMLVFLLAACSEEKVKEVSKEVEAKSESKEETNLKEVSKEVESKEESKEETNDKEVVATPFNPVELLGNYILDNEYFSKVTKIDDKTLFLETMDGCDLGTLVFEVIAVGDKEVDVIVTEANVQEILLGTKFKLKLNDDKQELSLVALDNQYNMPDIMFVRSQLPYEQFHAEKEEKSQQYGLFVDAVNDFLEYDDVWGASTGEKEVGFFAMLDDETGKGIIASGELGQIEGDTEYIYVSVDEYTESSFKGTVSNTPESKSDWLGQEVTIEKIDDNNILIIIGEEEITLNNGQ